MQAVCSWLFWLFDGGSGTLLLVIAVVVVVTMAVIRGVERGEQ